MTAATSTTTCSTVPAMSWRLKYRSQNAAIVSGTNHHVMNSASPVSSHANLASRVRSVPERSQKLQWYVLAAALLAAAGAWWALNRSAATPHAAAPEPVPVADSPRAAPATPAAPAAPAPPPLAAAAGAPESPPPTAAKPAQRRVLLLLSDGQPNDVDWYQGAYAIEDSRRALNEARAEGVVPFCLTVEQDEHETMDGKIVCTNSVKQAAHPSR